VISGTPASKVIVGQQYSFQPTASDPDGQALTFSITNKPSWANLDATTGRLSGTPPTANITYIGIVITVTDGALSASLPAFTITVDPVNEPPVISGAPSTSGTVGQPYSFQPTANDPEGKPLTFSIVGKPAWASFDAATGRLSGTPVAGDVGTYSGIVISVSDGTFSTSLAPFSITVVQVQAGAATVSWTAPTQNENGTPLTNLAGFRVYYGTSGVSLSQKVEIPGTATTTIVIENLAVGTWYFGVTAYTATGAESAVSEIKSKVIN
jgi:hypothetical protein